MDKQVGTALISVFDKTGLIELSKALTELGITIFSTGGTARALRDGGIPVTDVSDVTGFPEILDGRVKTLHPRIHGGILAIRDDSNHRRQVEQHEIPWIDMVVVNLYPFQYDGGVTGPAFADRHGELRQLTTALVNRERVFLISPRRYGKTSLLVNLGARVDSRSDALITPQ